MSPIALITGAGRGIGAATSRELAGRGYHVIVNYRGDAESARKVVNDIESAGGTAEAVQADVCDPAQVKTLIAACPTIDVLVCNANIQPPFAPLETMSWETFHAKVRDELAAIFHITQQALPLMRERQRGGIVYISSINSELTSPGSIAHSSAKAALDAFARQVAAEAAPHGIAVNTIAPSAVSTDATADIINAEGRAALAKRSVLHRMLEPEDVAKAITATLDACFSGVTGTRTPIDGGFRILT